MLFLRKSLDAITLDDLNDLVTAGARETAELEFEGTLPFVPTKDQSATADRWIERGDRVGEYARDKLLAEIVAFANADGGTLVIGLHETKTEPRCAERLEPLPNCEGLARRLLDATEDVIEPRLPTIAVRAIRTGSDGSGYVIFRVGQSLAGPHRLTTTREFYVRRGERSAKMSVREIKDHTLDLARTGDRVESIFAERRATTASWFKTLKKNAEGTPVGISPLIFRATAFPTSPQFIPEITKRQDLWWKGKGFTLKVDETPLVCDYPLRECNEMPKVRLRSLVSEVDLKYDSLPRLLRSDGLVEFAIVHPKRDAFRGLHSRIYLGWFVGLLAGVISQVDRLKSLLAWDAVEYGIDLEIWSTPPLSVSWDDRAHNASTLKADLPFSLPRYSHASGDRPNDLVSAAISDMFNACGVTANLVCAVPWAELKEQ